MIHVGIDFSILSTAICVYDTITEEIEFATFARKRVVRDHVHKDLQNSGVYICLQDEHDIEKHMLAGNRNCVLDSEQLSDAIFSYIKTKYDIYGGVKVCIESFSFGSTGNRLVQLAGYQYILRNKLAKLIGVENLYFVAPQTVKSIAGASKKGQNKKDMLDCFMDLDGNIKDNSFYINIKHNNYFRNKNNKIQKPVDDIVDSYYIMKSIKRYEES